ncbi:MAG TPA: hypothetical protein VGL42_06925 [Opitutaceae bacterium]|jgi:hypothetical protein
MNTHTSSSSQFARALAALSALITLIAATSQRAKAGDNVVQKLIPAFYQHQGDNGPVKPKPPQRAGPVSNLPSKNKIWSPDKGYCAFVADMDALYPWEQLAPFGVQLFDNSNAWLFGKPGKKNPGTGKALSSAKTWAQTADDTVIPALSAANSLPAYLKAQKVDAGSLGLAGLVDTQYQVKVGGQVQVATIGGWKNVTGTTFQVYQGLTSAGSNLPAGQPGQLQQLAAITTTIRLNYTAGNGPGTTGFWWGFHQVAGAGTAGANTIQISDPDAIPLNAANHNGGNDQAAVNANQYTAGQQKGAPPVPGNDPTYTANRLYGTLVINAQGEVTGGNTPYAAGFKKGAKAPVTRITNMDSVALPAVQLINNLAQAAFNAVTLKFTGDFGGDISKMEVFTNSSLANPVDGFGLSDNDPDWSVSAVTEDPFGNAWGAGFAGVELQEGNGGSDLMEGATEGAAPSYTLTEDTAGAVSGWTVFAFDQATGDWLTESYNPTVGFNNTNQVPDGTPTWVLALVAGLLLAMGNRILPKFRQR